MRTSARGAFTIKRGTVPVLSSHCPHRVTARVELTDRTDEPLGTRACRVSACRPDAVREVAPLGLHDAVALPTDRSTQQRRHPVGEDDDSQRTVEEVCRALDGLPLAIELAAARTRILPVHEIARRLDDRFALLRDPTRNLPERQSTLRAALAWTYDLLFPDDQRGLWAIAYFTGDAPSRPSKRC